MKATALAILCLSSVMINKAGSPPPSLRRADPTMDPAWKILHLMPFDAAIKAFAVELWQKSKAGEMYLERGDQEELARRVAAQESSLVPNPVFLTSTCPPVNDCAEIMYR